MVNRNVVYRMTAVAALGLAAFFVLSTTIQAQNKGPFSDVKAWGISYRIIVKTKEHCCDIESQSTTEGHPDWLDHYSIDQRYEGGFLVSGPLPGGRLNKVKADPGADTRRSPTLIAQNMKDYLGWLEPETDADAKPRSFKIDINDELRTDDTLETCTKTNVTSAATFKFNSTVSWMPDCQLAFDMVSHLFTIQFPVLPAEDDDIFRVVDWDLVKHRFTTDYDDPNKPGDEGTQSGKEYLKAFFAFKSPSFYARQLRYSDTLNNGVKEIHVCKNEQVTSIYAPASKVYELTPRRIKDIVQNKTVTISFQINMVEALPVIGRIPPLDPNCN